MTAGTGSMADASVVIVNFNAGSFLRESVASALQCLDVSSVVIVDNASEDSSLDLVPHDDRIQIVRNERNLGFAAASNIGIARSSSDCVLLLNPDCRIASGTLVRLMETLFSSDRIGMVGPCLMNEDGTEQAGGRRHIPTPKLAFARATGLSLLFPHRFKDFGLHHAPLPDAPVEVEAISGACMLVRRAAIADVGPMDEGYFLHCEDLDWCMRFLQRDWKILFVPDVTAIHHKGASSGDRVLRVELHKHRGMVRFYEKFFLASYPRWVSLPLLAGVWLRFLLIAVRVQVARLFL